MADIKAPALSPALIRQAEFVRNVWSVTVPPGIPMSSVLAPEFWAHCSKSFKQHDKIECRAQDNAWYAEMLVGKVEKQSVRMLVLFYTDLNAQTAPREAVEQYTVSFAPKQRWRVIRASDGEVVHKDEATEEAARQWLAEFVSVKA